MDTEFLLPERARRLPPSPLRELLRLEKNEDTLDLAGGHPDPSLFPVSLLAKVSAQLLSSPSAPSLAYSSTEGLPALRAAIAERLRRRGLEVPAERILITSGSQNALAAVAWALSDVQSLALLEAPGYPGARQAFSAAGATLAALPLTATGWDFSAFERLRPRVAYVAPTNQNPTGRRVLDVDQLDLVRAAHDSKTWLVEDDAYGELSFDGAMRRPLMALAPKTTLLVGSFSKIIAPGLRVGFIVAPEPLLQPLTRYLQATHLQPSTFAEHLVFEVLKDDSWDAHLARSCATYFERMKKLSTCLTRFDFEHERPAGGLFVWARSKNSPLTFPKLAQKAHLLCVPEEIFRLPKDRDNDGWARFSYGQPFDDAKLTARLQAIQSNAL